MNRKDTDTMLLFKSSNVMNSVSKRNKSKLPPADKDDIEKWNKCLSIIKDNIADEQIFKTWFEPINVLKIEDNVITLIVPSQFFHEWIEENFYDLLKKTIKSVIGKNAKLSYEVVVDDSEDSLEKRTIKVPGLKYPPSQQSSLPFDVKKESDKEFHSNLNPIYIFDNFITGDSNQFASSAAQAVSNNPGRTRFNPLVIYGDTGVGKTHLIQAVGNSIIQENTDKRVLYTTSEKFYYDFVEAIKYNKTNEFISFYRSIDVLIVDDIQFFEGKDKTQDNFFHTFNALHQSGKQVILSSDRPPKELKGVDSRLISRFNWGLTVDIQAPDYEMRVAILHRKSQDEGIELPIEVIEFMAKNIKSNIRELEGALISVIAKITLDGKPINIETAREVLHGVVSVEPKPLTIEDIKEKVATYYKLSIDIIESKSRKHEIVLARQMAMYFSKLFTNNSLKNIGSYFGGRDHTTVLHSCQTIENYLVTDKAVKNAYETLFNLIKGND